MDDDDKITLIGSYDLLSQFKTFIENNILGSIVKMQKEVNYYRLYIYGYTARAAAELLYGNCSIALNRKLAKAQMMYA